MKLNDDRFEHLKDTYTLYLPKLASLHEDFGGPSIYFHQRALRSCKEAFLSDEHLEMIYATLTAWGMHRMGRTKTKMVDYPTFQKSIRDIVPTLKELNSIKPEDIIHDEKILTTVRDVCFEIKVSVSDSKIVGNSKALAHILPDLAPPIDRRHTIAFFAKYANNFEHEEEAGIYGYILSRCLELISLLKEDKLIRLDDHFNTSYPKVFDNLVILYMKAMKDRKK